MPARIRTRIPGAALRTTCLVGYPGEKREHFMDLLDFIKESEFDRLGVFAFSREEGTIGFDLPEQIDERTAARRRDRLMLAQQKIVDKKASELIGGVAEILVERPGSVRKGGRTVWIGRSAGHAPEVDGSVILTGMSQGNHSGRFVMARYTGVDGYDLRAEFVRVS